jgi:hypothetical protein
LRKTFQTLTPHFTALDPIGHDSGPFSAEALASLERLETVIGNLREVAERRAPGRAAYPLLPTTALQRPEHH